MLTEDETFICWDRYEEENWIRKPPPFAIRSHPLLDARMENYQTFLPRTTQDGIIMIGTRASESVQRLINMSDRKMNQMGDRKFVPIYDWKDHDVWLYLYQNHIDIPVSYVQMWQVGVPKNQLRISQFFSIDTAKCLVKMAEFKPDLMNRIIKREPNAYLASLYFDSEMFRRSSSNRRKIEKEEDNKDYKRMVIQLLSDINGNFDTELQRKVAQKYKYSMMKAIQYDSSQAIFKKMYEGLIAGDPKLRTHRAVNNLIFTEYHDKVRKGKA
jgi:predicted phosphoadenosine phosphosulfate sulfurtransferase